MEWILQRINEMHEPVQVCDHETYAGCLDAPESCHQCGCGYPIYVECPTRVVAAHFHDLDDIIALEYDDHGSAHQVEFRESV